MVLSRDRLTSNEFNGLRNSCVIEARDALNKLSSVLVLYNLRNNSLKCRMSLFLIY